jgi:hypothetical protein
MQLRTDWRRRVVRTIARFCIVVSVLLSSSGTISPTANKTDLASGDIGQAIATAAGLALGAVAALAGPHTAVAQVAATSYDAELGSGFVPWLGGQYCGLGGDVTLVTLGSVPAGSTILFQGHATGNPDAYPARTIEMDVRGRWSADPDQRSL